VFWVKPTATLSFAAAYGNDNTVSTNKGVESFLNSGSSSSGFFGNGTANAAGTFSNSLTTGTWAFLGVTYDGTNIQGYLNGSAFGAAGSLTGPISAGANNFGIGFNPASGGSAFIAANLAGFAIYNRALTSGEMSTINGL
jgi:hypothetical protein